MVTPWKTEHERLLVVAALESYAQQMHDLADETEGFEQQSFLSDANALEQIALSIHVKETS